MFGAKTLLLSTWNNEKASCCLYSGFPTFRLILLITAFTYNVKKISFSFFIFCTERHDYYKIHLVSFLSQAIIYF